MSNIELIYKIFNFQGMLLQISLSFCFGQSFNCIYEENVLYVNRQENFFLCCPTVTLRGISNMQLLNPVQAMRRKRRRRVSFDIIQIIIFDSHLISYIYYFVFLFVQQPHLLTIFILHMLLSLIYFYL